MIRAVMLRLLKDEGAEAGLKILYRISLKLWNGINYVRRMYKRWRRQVKSYIDRAARSPIERLYNEGVKKIPRTSKACCSEA